MPARESIRTRDPPSDRLKSPGGPLSRRRPACDARSRHALDHHRTHRCLRAPPPPPLERREADLRHRRRARLRRARRPLRLPRQGARQGRRRGPRARPRRPRPLGRGARLRGEHGAARRRPLGGGRPPPRRASRPAARAARALDGRHRRDPAGPARSVRLRGARALRPGDRGQPGHRGHARDGPAARGPDRSRDPLAGYERRRGVHERPARLPRPFPAADPRGDVRRRRRHQGRAALRRSADDLGPRGARSARAGGCDAAGHRAPPRRHARGAHLRGRPARGLQRDQPQGGRRRRLEFLHRTIGLD